MDQMVASLLAPGIDADADETLNEQVQRVVRQAILSGQLGPGVRLPASRALAKRLSLSRNTVLAAYDQLLAEGYLETRQGAGTYVATDLPDPYLTVAAEGVAASQAGIQPVRARPNRPLSGMPALDHFPTALWARLGGSIWRHAGTHDLTHMDPAGYLPLRAAIADYLKAARGVVATPDQIIILTGLHQGLRLVAESVVAEDRAIILEDPGYPGLVSAASTLRHPLVYTGVDADGALPPDHIGQPGLMVVSPSRQYPLGHTMSLRRRLDLLDWARRTGCLILEDDYDSEFRYAGRPVSSLQGIDGGQQVIYGGSFSKALFVALRLGYLVLPARLAARVVAHRDATDSFPAIGPQLHLRKFITGGHFARHLRHLRTIHRTRLHLFMKAAYAHLSPWFSFADTDAGLHVVAYRHDDCPLPDTRLAALGHAARLGAVPLSDTYRHAVPRHGLMIGFADLPDNEIESRVKDLGQRIGQETGFSSLA